VTIPGTGPAVYQIEYEHLKGTYNIIVAKLDGEENSCSIQISGDTVTLKEFTPGGFVDVVTSEEEW
jgi:hypothetical protein